MNEIRLIDLTIFSSGDWIVIFFGDEKMLEHHRIDFEYGMAHLIPMINSVMFNSKTRIRFFSHYIEDDDMDEVFGSNDIKEYLERVDW